MTRVTAAEEIRSAFYEGFVVSKLHGPIETAWQRSDARQNAAIADDLDTQMRLFNFIEALAQLPLTGDDPRATLTSCINNARKLIATVNATTTSIHESGRPCGCDPGAHWTCEQHRSAVPR